MSDASCTRNYVSNYVSTFLLQRVSRALHRLPVPAALLAVA